MSNEIVLGALVVAVILAIYLLRHIIVLAIRLVVLAALVLAGYWVWQHRGELIDAAEPYLGGLGDHLRELDLPDLPDVLDLAGASEDPGAREDTGMPETAGLLGEAEAPDTPEAPEGPEDPEEPDRPQDPNVPE